MGRESKVRREDDKKKKKKKNRESKIGTVMPGGKGEENTRQIPWRRTFLFFFFVGVCVLAYNFDLYSNHFPCW